MQQPRLILFDFDGTIADTFELARVTGNALARENGFRTVTREEALALRRMSFTQVVRFLGIPLHRVPWIVARARTEMRSRVTSAEVVPGMATALGVLRERGFRLGVYTSNLRAIVYDYLAAHGLAQFELVHATSDMLGKARGIKRLVKELGLAPAEVAYVCDEIRDVEAAQSAGIGVVAVGWGYNEAEALAALKPNALVRSAPELLEVFTAPRRT